jgi:flagellar basal-body rod protein FlgB
MSILETPLMRGLERVLDQTAFRHQVLATNLANVDTPNYHARDIRSFAGEIEQAMADEGSAEATPMGPVSYEMRGLNERPDGNNVSVERETLLVAQNQLRFQVAIAFLKDEFHRLTLAINGGSTS